MLVPNKAYVSYEGDDYEVDPTTFSFIESAINQANSQGETPTEASAGLPEGGRRAQGRRLRRKPDQRRQLPTSAAPKRPRSAATSTSPGAIDQILKLAENPACSSSLESAGPLPLAPTRRSQGRSRKGAQGRPRRRLRRRRQHRPQGHGRILDRTAEGAGEKVDIELDLTLNGVNEEQEIEAPSGAKPLSGLFQKLGVNPIELLEGIQSGEGLGLEGLLNEAIGGAGRRLRAQDPGRRAPARSRSKAARSRRAARPT